MKRKRSLPPSFSILRFQQLLEGLNCVSQKPNECTKYLAVPIFPSAMQLHEHVNCLSFADIAAGQRELHCHTEDMELL